MNKNYDVISNYLHFKEAAEANFADIIKIVSL